jgi:hypothetical protein
METFLEFIPRYNFTSTDSRFSLTQASFFGMDLAVEAETASLG